MGPEFYGYLQLLQSYLQQTSILLLETPLEEGQGLGMSDLQFSNGLSLDLFFRPNQFEKIRKFIAKKYNIDINKMLHFKPLALIQMLQQAENSGKGSIFPEMILHEMASEEGMPVEGLETVEFQFDLLTNTAIEEQIRSLKSFVRNPVAQKKHLAKLTRTYKSQDLPALHKMIRKQSGGIRKTYLFDRNKSMATNLVKYLKEGSVFCAVGAGHLWGGKGMLRLVKQAGFSLDPIHLNASN